MTFNNLNHGQKGAVRPVCSYSSTFRTGLCGIDPSTISLRWPEPVRVLQVQLEARVDHAAGLFHQFVPVHDQLLP